MQFVNAVIILCAAYTITYFCLFFLITRFFKSTAALPPRRALVSLLFTFLFVIIGYAIIFTLPHPIWGNRFQHGFCGGFISFLLYFFVVKDSGVILNKFQFFVFGVLVVTTLGVGNELLEYVLHNYFSMVMSTYINDTWLDLISNTTGLLLASVCFVPFLNTSPKTE
jgi:hypothetical protein